MKGKPLTAKQMEDLSKQPGGPSVEDLKRYNEDQKRKEFQARAIQYLGFDPKDPEAGQKAQDQLYRLGKDRGLNPNGMLERLQLLDPNGKVPDDLKPYMQHVQSAKQSDEDYKKKYTGGDTQKALLEQCQKQANEAESKVKDNREIAGNLNITVTEVESYVKTLQTTSGVTEAEARRQLKKKGPANYDANKSAPDPAKLAADLKAIHAIPDANKRREELDKIMASMPPRAMLGALMRAGEEGDGLVKGPVANEALKTQLDGVEKLPPDKQWEAYVNLTNMTGMPFRDLRLSYKNRDTKEQALNGASGILNNNKLTEEERQKKLEELGKKLNLSAEQLRKAYAAENKRTEEALAGYMKATPKGVPTNLKKAIEELQTKDLTGDALEQKLNEISRLTGVPVDQLRRYQAEKFRKSEGQKYGEKLGLPGDKAYDQLLEWSRQYQCTPEEMMAMLRNCSPDKCPPELAAARAKLLEYDRTHPTEDTTEEQKLKAMKRAAGIGENEKAQKLVTDPDAINKMPDGPDKAKAMMDLIKYQMKVNAFRSKLDESIVEDDEAYALLKDMSPREIAAMQADKNLVDEDGVSLFKSFLDGCDGDPYQKWGKELFKQGDAYNELLNSDLQQKIDKKQHDADAMLERGQQNKALAAALGGTDANGTATPIPIQDASSYVDAYAQAHGLSRDQAMGELSNPPPGKTAKDLIGELYKPSIHKDPATGKTISEPSAYLKAELNRINALPEDERGPAYHRIMGYSGLKEKDIQAAQKQVTIENHIVLSLAAVEMLPEAEQKKALEKLAEDLGKKPEEILQIQDTYKKAMGEANARFEAAKKTYPAFKADLDAPHRPREVPGLRAQEERRGPGPQDGHEPGRAAAGRAAAALPREPGLG
ncbi:MAG: hypothetical protein ABIO70_24520 [Pseudomonadota bacterium]